MIRSNFDIIFFIIDNKIVFEKTKWLIFSFFLLILLFPQQTRAWGGDVHDYLCPKNLQNVEIQGKIEGCRIADSMEFQRTYPYAEVMSHLCLDNKPDCPGRIVAKYYVKKYYFEGQKDLKLLAGAAHLLQDATCPDHWFPMREFGKRIFVPFAPSWVSKTEPEVSLGLSSRQPGWSVIRQYKGETIVLNQTYMDNLKSEIAQFVNSEPKEDLATLEKQIKAKSLWNKVRSYRELALVGVLLLLPFLGFYLWHWFAKKTSKTDLLIIAFLEVIFLAFFASTYIY
jgi:hypothetical protein